MSNIAMIGYRLSFLFFSLLLAAPFLGCTRTPPTPLPALGRPLAPALGFSDPLKIEKLSLSARLPGAEAWNARLERDATDSWTILGPVPDLADPKLVGHFLEVFGTFVTEARAPNGNDTSFGLSPYRFEIRIPTANGDRVLRLGDSAGLNGVYFRIDEAPEVWIGRGALTALFPSFATADALVWKSPFRAPFEKINALRLKKHYKPDFGAWSFTRRNERWESNGKALSKEKSALIERIVRQRILQIVAAYPAEQSTPPDWTIEIETPSGTETLSIAYPLNGIYGSNPARSTSPLELYPEMAGALRAFTQARFTPLKSGTK